MELTDILPFPGVLAPEPAPEVDVDAALMLESASDAPGAFAELVRRHQQALVNFFLRSGAYAESEDLAQETFVRLYRYRHRYQATARFSTFLYVLARNVWSDRGRKLQRQDRLAAELQIQANVVEEPENAEPGRAMDAATALDRLSPKLREVIVLNIYQGLRYQEVADVLDIPLGTVKSRINLALQTLRETLE